MRTSLYKSLLKTATMCMIAMVLSVGAFAQPGGDDDLGDADENVPIDGGLSLALAAGAGYLVKRRHDAKKKKAEKDKQILP